MTIISEVVLMVTTSLSRLRIDVYPSLDHWHQLNLRHCAKIRPLNLGICKTVKSSAMKRLRGVRSLRARPSMATKRRVRVAASGHPCRHCLDLFAQFFEPLWTQPVCASVSITFVSSLKFFVKT